MNIHTLEDILIQLGSKHPFLDTLESDTDGNRNPFTFGGARAYKTLTDILYATENITGINFANEAIEILDDIANEYF